MVGSHEPPPEAPGAFQQAGTQPEYPAAPPTQASALAGPSEGGGPQAVHPCSDPAVPVLKVQLSGDLEILPTEGYLADPSTLLQGNSSLQLLRPFEPDAAIDLTSPAVHSSEDAAVSGRVHLGSGHCDSASSGLGCSDEGHREGPFRPCSNKGAVAENSGTEKVQAESGGTDTTKEMPQRGQSGRENNEPEKTEAKDGPQSEQGDRDNTETAHGDTEEGPWSEQSERGKTEESAVLETKQNVEVPKWDEQCDTNRQRVADDMGLRSDRLNTDKGRTVPAALSSTSRLKAEGDPGLSLCERPSTEKLRGIQSMLSSTNRLKVSRRPAPWIAEQVAFFEQQMDEVKQEVPTATMQATCPKYKRSILNVDAVQGKKPLCFQNIRT